MSKRITLVGGNRCGEEVVIDYPGEEKDAASGYSRTDRRDGKGREVWQRENGGRRR